MKVFRDGELVELADVKSQFQDIYRALNELVITDFRILTTAQFVNTKDGKALNTTSEQFIEETSFLDKLIEDINDIVNKGA